MSKLGFFSQSIFCSQDVEWKKLRGKTFDYILSIEILHTSRCVTSNFILIVSAFAALFVFKIHRDAFHMIHANHGSRLLGLGLLFTFLIYVGTNNRFLVPT